MQWLAEFVRVCWVVMNRSEQLDALLLEYVRDNGPQRYQMLEHAFDYSYNTIAASVNRLKGKQLVRNIPSGNGRDLVAAVMNDEWP